MGDAYADSQKNYDAASSVSGVADPTDGSTTTGIIHQLPELKALPHLRLLSLPETKVTDDGLKVLKGCTSLKRLLLPRGITDAGLKEIKEALIKKAAGRVFQTDTDFSTIPKPSGASAAEWQTFAHRTADSDLYFDLTIKC